MNRTKPRFMNIYIAQNGQRIGPYTVAEAQALAAAGTVHANDFAWYEGLADWIPLQQVPGFVPQFTATSTAPVERPAMVWVISLFYFVCTPISLLSMAVLMPLMASGAFPVPENQRHFFESQGVFDYVLMGAGMVLTLVWAIQFFRLKRMSLYLYLGIFGLGIANTIYNIVAHDW